MNKKIPSLILFVLLMLSMLSGLIPTIAAFPSGYDPLHVIVDTIGEPETLDPAWSYDTSSGTIIQNVYDRVIWFETVYSDYVWGPFTDGPYAAGKMDRFAPSLATEFMILPGPGPYVKTFYFKIRGSSTTHTFTASSDVNLLKDGAIYDGTYAVRDPEYGVVGKIQGPIRPAIEIPPVDGAVDRFQVPANVYAGGSPMGTTWQRHDGPTPTRGCVIRSWSDLDTSGDLSAGDYFDVVRKCHNHPKGPWWNARNYHEVISYDAGTNTITANEEPAYWHDSATYGHVTPEDVEYSWERWMVQDRSGGPQWMIYFPVLGVYGAVPPGTDPNFGDQIDDAIGSNATHAWVSLMTDFPETTFLQIMAQAWASIVCKQWCIDHGDFDGNWAAGWETIYNTWHDPDISFIEDDMMGSGPYMLDYWVHGTAYSIVRNPDYWDGWPHHVSSTGTERLPGYINRVTLNLLVSWTTRRARFLAGDADYTYVPRQFRDQILGQSVAGHPIRCHYPVEPNIATSANFYTWDVTTSSPYLGPGFDPGDPNRILGDRVPANLFSDQNVRQGFTSAFDLDLYIAAAFLGEAEAPATPIVKGLSYRNPNAQAPVFDMTKAEEYLKAAWIGHPDDNLATPEGALWDNGMKMEVLYNEGNVARETAATMIANSINSLNPLFDLTTRSVAWGSTYLPQMIAGMLPTFIIGWLLDYPDADNFAFPFMHTYGTFSHWQGYSNTRVDELIEWAALQPDDTAAYNGELDYADPRPYFDSPPGSTPPDSRWPRLSCYYELQALYDEDRPGFCLAQAIGRNFQQSWNRGWFFAPILPGAYWAQRWKANSEFGDVNNDGLANVLDSARVSAAWTKPSTTSALGVLGYMYQSDITGGTGGTTGSNYGLILGIPDGKVDVVDSSLISANWD